MIDFETVAAVRTRAPQYSYTGKYASNLFGLESEGQLKILKSLSEDGAVNPGEASFEGMRSAFFSARREQLARRMLDLFGTDPSRTRKIIAKNRGELEWLSDEFERLAVRMFPNLPAMKLEEEAGELGVYDFSRFFRLYPLLRREFRGEELAARGFNLLLSTGAADFEFRPNSELSETVVKLLKDRFIIASEKEFSVLNRDAARFVRRYELFLQKLETQGLLGSRTLQEIRAYVVNENRTLMEMLPLYRIIKSIVAEYRDGILSAARAEKIIDWLYQANNRLFEPLPDGNYQADMRIFREGYTCTILRPDGSHAVRLAVFSDMAGFPENSGIIPMKAAAGIGGRDYPLVSRIDDGMLILETPFMDNRHLADISGRNQPVRLTLEGKLLGLTER